ncbi:TetR/AcrR family transcriptional regulator [Luteibacter sp. 3190]|uniref:TetR/AcrR family transcriptional regulator n=1 Tax=Luteibacter sp. 3190 TaxID=2817736 RepID=UPI0028550AE4|nr:TetR/AcrR family transcriptional regulator [Luteibacter sp. 3190]MDR6935464.1 AcrR family transcriptional regulator [Luteibacter sp. 3190]
MARPREFDRDTALQRAIDTFAMHGFEGTSTPMLLDAMKIGRQSLYDTFGDKRSLYLEALRTYSNDSVGMTLSAMFASTSVREGIEQALLGFAKSATSVTTARACLGIHAITEFGTLASDVKAVTDEIAGRTVLAFESRIREGIARGELAADLDAAATAQFLLATLSGLKIAARAGSDLSTLQGIVGIAMRALR